MDFIQGRIEKLDSILKDSDYKGYDPFDVLNSPFFSFLPEVFYYPNLILSKFGSRIATDSVRKLLRVPKIEDPKTYSCAYFGYKILGEKYRKDASIVLERLVKMGNYSNKKLSWGYDYTWPTLYDGTNRKGSSTLVPASFSIFSLIFEILTGDSTNYSNKIQEAINFYENGHSCQNKNGKFLGYFINSTINTHNANLLGCTALSLCAKFKGNDKLFDIAVEATNTTLKSVQSDGFLSYNDHKTGNWTDSFHHLYVISCLIAIQQTNPRADSTMLEDLIEKMKDYYIKHFINKDGTINYYPDKVHPIDCHNYATAIIFSILFGNGKLMDKVPVETLFENVDSLTWNEELGRYSHRIHKNRVDNRFFLRWNQAWMFLALSVLQKRDEIISKFSFSLLDKRSFKSC